MIMVTRRNLSPFALNPDLIERVEATPDTVITLVSGTKYVVAEPVDQVIDLVRDFRASVVSVSSNGRWPVEAPRQTRLRPVSDLEH